MSNWKTCGNCMEFLMCPIQTKSALAWCTYWKPIPCPLCGGPLSEIREHNGKKYRHCYSCHFEYEEET